MRADLITVCFVVSDRVIQSVTIQRPTYISAVICYSALI